MVEWLLPDVSGQNALLPVSFQYNRCRNLRPKKIGCGKVTHLATIVVYALLSPRRRALTPLVIQ